MDDVSEGGRIHGGLVASADEGLSRRMKALACTAPLHELDQRKHILKWADAAVYQMAEIALHTIDHVALAMDFDAGADHDLIVSRVKRFVALQTPDRPAAEHERVAEWVLSSLINVGNVDRGFRGYYGRIDRHGRYRLDDFDFKLIAERRDTQGDLYLLATDQALNVLVGALDTDIESAQIAAEVKLDNLIHRGRLEDAKLTAEQARIRTIQYAESIRVYLDATRRNVKSVDWLRIVPNLLTAALDHIVDRMSAERKIAQHAAATRDQVDEPAQKAKAAEVVEIVEDCIRRHTRLQRRLQEARQVFRDEQDRQLAIGRPRPRTFDLHAQLLRPVLDLPVSDASASLALYFDAEAAPTVTDLPYLTTLIPLLMQPPPERTRFAGEIPQPELVPAPEPDRFSDDQWAAAWELLELPDAVRTLSDLIEEAVSVDPQLPHLVALLAMNAFSPRAGSALRRGEERLLISVEAGSEFETDRYGGDDLLLTTARLLPTDADFVAAEEN